MAGVSGSPEDDRLLGLDLPATSLACTRWLFADQLGPHFLDDPGGPVGTEDAAHDPDSPAPRQGVVLVESRRVFARKRYHRRKAHLVLSAMRHRAAELGERARLVVADTYRQGLAEAGVDAGSPVSVVDPTSRPARRLVRSLAAAGLVEVVADQAHAISHAQFSRWAHGRGPGGRRLLMEDFYRDVRRQHGLLMDGDQPVGGQWNYDHDNREPPPRATTLGQATGLAEPWWPVEDDIDAAVREDLDRISREGREGIEFVGDDGPRRFAVTRTESLAALDHFLDARLDAFGPHEDAMLAGDPWMAHSLLSVPLNLGLLHPLEVARRAEARLRDGGAALASVEGFVRQVVGWREYIWHLYWHLGPEHARRNVLGHTEPLPEWFTSLDAGGEVRAACLSDVLGTVRREGWAHHIPRLMVLAGYALARGFDPQQLTDWFHTSFVDGYDWVMSPNVIGMSQHADGGVLATKPYWSGGGYIDRMSDYCRRCQYDPRVRLGPTACPFTAGYWAFTARHRDLLAANPRTRRAVSGLDRLSDADAVLAQERERGADAP